MLSNLSKMGRRAFTLVELIIVIVIVGILAAISIVGYQAVVERAEEAAAEATADSVAREVNALIAFEAPGTHSEAKTAAALAAADEDITAVGATAAQVADSEDFTVTVNDREFLVDFTGSIGNAPTVTKVVTSS